MDRRFLFASLGAFVTSFVLSFIVHGLILSGDYMTLLNVYRGPQFRPGLFAVLLAAMAIMSVAMTAIYRHGREERPFLGQGLRFGLMAAGLSVIPCYMIGYAVTNIPATLAMKQVVLETMIVTAMAVVVAWFHRDFGKAGVR